MMIGYLVTIEVMVKDHDEWVMVEKPCYCLLLRKAMKKAKSLHENGLRITSEKPCRFIRMVISLMLRK